MVNHATQNILHTHHDTTAYTGAPHPRRSSPTASHHPILSLFSRRATARLTRVICVYGSSCQSRRCRQLGGWTTASRLVSALTSRRLLRYLSGVRPGSARRLEPRPDVSATRGGGTGRGSLVAWYDSVFCTPPSVVNTAAVVAAWSVYSSLRPSAPSRLPTGPAGRRH